MSLVRAFAVSIVSALVGFGVSVLVLLLFAWSGMHQGGSIRQALAFWLVFVGGLNVIGWLAFLLPMALLLSGELIQTKLIRIRSYKLVLFGTAVGIFLVTALYTYFFHGMQYAVRGSLMWEVSGAANAAVATALCASLIRHKPLT